jgi:hypothetical protein
MGDFDLTHGYAPLNLIVSDAPTSFQ